MGKDMVLGLALGAVAGWACVWGQAEGARVRSYDLVDLGPGGACGVNDKGQVVGEMSLPDGGLHAFLCDRGKITDLGTLAGGYSRAKAINNAGTVVGTSGSADIGWAPFLWEATNGMRTPGTGNTAEAVNNLGQVAGGAGAYIWDVQGGFITFLGTLGGYGSYAWGINDAGQVVGWAYPPMGAYRPFLWDKAGGMTDLGTFGGTTGCALDVNNKGQVVGWAMTPHDVLKHAFLWSAEGGMIDLGTLGGQYSEATAINDGGRVVGWAHRATGVYFGGFIWDRVNGMVDLMGLIAGECNWDELTPRAISERGWIVGDGYINGWRHAFVMIRRPIYVDDDAAGANDGSSWADAFVDLQDALAVAEYGDEIRVGQGDYRPAGAGGDRAATFQLVDGVALRGGFAGVGAADPDARNVMTFTTVLSGDLNGDDGLDEATFGDNSHHVVTCERTGRSTVLHGFVVRDGVGEDNGGFGGGVRNERGSPTIVNCVFRTGRSVIGYSADAIYNRNESDPFIANCVFEGQGYGRGVVSEVCSPTIVNCVFVDCRWTAIEQYGGLPVIANCIFVGCRYVGFFDYSNADIRNCLFYGNEDILMLDGGAQPILTDCLDDVDPMFVDRWGGDYHLRVGSPCIDAGDSAAAAGIETDLDGGARISGARVDMGVFEAAAMIEGELSVMPRIINRASSRGRILARVRLPENVAIDEIDRNQALVLLPGGAAAERQYVFAVGRAGQKRVNIFAFFEVAALLAAVEQNGAVQVTVTGALIDGRRFLATDTVTIIGRGTPDQSKGPRTQAETGRSRTPSRSR